MRGGWRGRSAPDRGLQVGLFRVSGSGLGNLFGLLLGLPSASTTYRHIIGIRAGGQLAGDNNPKNCSGYEEGTWTPGDSPGISRPEDSPGAPDRSRHTTRTIVRPGKLPPAVPSSTAWVNFFIFLC